MKKVTKKVSKKKVAAKQVRRRTSPAMTAEINRRFDFVSNVSKEKTEDCVAIRAAFKKLAMQVARTTPPGRDQAMALTKLEEGLFNAIASIVRPTQGE